MKCTKTEIYDPFTKRCLKLQMKGTLYKRYIVPFLLGDDSFLNTFSVRDRQKFVMFLKREGLVTPEQFQRYTPEQRNTNRSEEEARATWNFRRFRNRIGEQALKRLRDFDFKLFKQEVLNDRRKKEQAQQQVEENVLKTAQDYRHFRDKLGEQAIQNTLQGLKLFKSAYIKKKAQEEEENKKKMEKTETSDITGTFSSLVCPQPKKVLHPSLPQQAAEIGGIRTPFHNKESMEYVHPFVFTPDTIDTTVKTGTETVVQSTRNRQVQSPALKITKHTPLAQNLYNQKEQEDITPEKKQSIQQGLFLPYNPVPSHVFDIPRTHDKQKDSKYGVKDRLFPPYPRVKHTVIHPQPLLTYQDDKKGTKKTLRNKQILRTEVPPFTERSYTFKREKGKEKRQTPPPRSRISPQDHKSLNIKHARSINQLLKAQDEEETKNEYSTETKSHNYTPSIMEQSRMFSIQKQDKKEQNRQTPPRPRVSPYEYHRSPNQYKFVIKPQDLNQQLLKAQDEEETNENIPHVMNQHKQKEKKRTPKTKKKSTQVIIKRKPVIPSKNLQGKKTTEEEKRRSYSTHSNKSVSSISLSSTFDPETTDEPETLNKIIQYESLPTESKKQVSNSLVKRSNDKKAVETYATILINAIEPDELTDILNKIEEQPSQRYKILHDSIYSFILLNTTGDTNTMLTNYLHTGKIDELAHYMLRKDIYTGYAELNKHLYNRLVDSRSRSSSKQQSKPPSRSSSNKSKKNQNSLKQKEEDAVSMYKKKSLRKHFDTFREYTEYEKLKKAVQQKLPKDVYEHEFLPELKRHKNDSAMQIEILKDVLSDKPLFVNNQLIVGRLRS